MIKTASLVLPIVLAADAPDLRIAGREPVDALVNGHPARVLVDPGAPSMPVFDPAFAAKAGFRSGWIDVSARVGPVLVPGETAVLRYRIGSAEFKRRTAWFTAPFVDGADGTLGPGGVPASVVRFDLHSPAPGERTVSLPLSSFGTLGAAGMGYRLPLGDRSVEVRFSLTRDRTVATASAGAAFAAAFAGKLDGPAEAMRIHLRIDRPVRRLALARALVVGPIAIDRMMVRTSDFGSAGSIPDAAAPAPDPDEIVVTGRKKQKDLWLEIGRDYLGACSSIVFDKRRKIVTLSCR